MVGGEMRALLILLLVPSFALGLAVGATRVVGQPTPAAAQPTAFVWADRVFVTGHDLDVWLKSRGSSYEHWAARHPSLAETFPISAKRALVLDAAQPSGGNSGKEETWWNVLLVALAAASGITLLIYLIDQSRPGMLRAFGHETGSLGRFRPDRGPSPERLVTAPRVRPAIEESHATLRHATLRRGWGAVAPRLAHVGPETVKRGRAAAEATRPIRRRIRRHYLPRIVFYSACVILAFVVGAAISGYLN